MQKPQSLKNGDTVAIVSPAGAVRDTSIIEGACRTLHSWGLNTTVAPNTLLRDGYYAGSATVRRDSLLSLINDNNIKAILCSYGGYGCIHIADTVADAIAENPKWIMGMSDCSVLHAACLSKGIMSLHSPQCRHLSESPQSEAALHLRDILFGGKAHYSTEPHPLNICGTAHGRIAGGNLSVLHSLISTPYDIFSKGTILFIEDINEPVYRIERMLYITQTIGFGERIVCEGSRRDKGTRQCITETGILIVKMPEEETMVTAYIPTLEQAGMIYKSVGLRMPDWMVRKIKKNQKYAKGCPA